MTSYSISFTDQPGAKARYRTALKLMGAANIRITEAEITSVTHSKPVKDNLPTSPEAKAVSDLFKRRHDTEWADREITAFRKLRKQGVMTMDNLAIITAYYTRERRKEQHYCRKDLMTFLNNFQGELDRAKAARPEASKANQWLDSTPKIIPMTTPEQDEKIRQQAKLAAEEFKRQHTA
jgi:hypothetical protein